LALNHPVLDEAWGLHRSGDHARAAELYKSVLRTDPMNADALYLLGLLYGQNRQFEDAQQFVGEAIRLNPSADGLLMRGYALQQLDRHDEAIACFTEALRLNPQFSEALLNRASSFFRSGRYEEAAADYEWLLAIDSDYPFVRGNRLFSRLHCCDWRGFSDEPREIAAQLAQGKRVIAPFDVKLLSLSPE